MNEELQIVMEIEGLDSEGGKVRFDAALAEMELLKSMLQQIDRLVDDEDRLAAKYQIVNATFETSLRVVIEPSKIIRKKRPVPTDARIVQLHRRFFGEMTGLHTGAPPSNEIDDGTLDTIHQMVKRVGNDFKSVTIANHAAIVPLDKELRKNVSFYRREVVSSIGTMTGKLEAANIHGQNNTFWIYPPVGPRRVRCEFKPKHKDKVAALWSKVISVSGKKFYRPKSPFPYRIEVDTFEEVKFDPSNHLINLKGIAKSEGQMPAAETVRLMKEDWEE